MQLLISLARGVLSPDAMRAIDEITAEILDGAEAVMEILGGQPDMATANRQLINLTQGRMKRPKKPTSCIVELNEMMTRLDLPLTRWILLERVEHAIGSTQNLTKEGPAAPAWPKRSSSAPASRYRMALPI